MRELMVVPLEDYNSLMGTEEQLQEGEALIYVTKKGEFTGDTISLDGEETWKIKKQADGFVQNGIDSQQVIPTVYLFLGEEDFQKVLDLFHRLEKKYSENTYASVNVQHSYYGIDIEGGDELQMAVKEDLEQRIAGIVLDNQEFPAVIVDCVAENRADFYGLYGGIFFLGACWGWSLYWGPC